MTTLDVTRTESLAQETYEFVSQRFPDYAGPVLALLQNLSIDRNAFIKLESAINGAINKAEHNGFTVGFVLSGALANVSIFRKVDEMDKVLRPDLYDAEHDRREREDENDRYQRWMY